MPIEIERRFLVRAPSAALSESAIIQRLEIRQGYLGWVGGLRIRVRIGVDQDSKHSATLTLKSRRTGICRQEYERPLDLDFAEHVLASLTSDRIISKTRYQILHPAGLVWSIDFFNGSNDGLVIAEVELADAEQRVELPSWVGEEITFDPRYGNSALARSPIGPNPRAPVRHITGGYCARVGSTHTPDQVASDAVA
jgi:adenylate cyclase